MVEKLCILGSTGSIGTQTLSLVEKLGIEVTALSGNKNVKLLEEQARRFKPQSVCACDEAAAADLKLRLADCGTRVLAGRDGLMEIAQLDRADTLLNSVVGVAGLEPTLAAINARKNLALANKETLVVGGKLVTDAVKANGVSMLPVDSEHSAIFQCLQASPGKKAKRIFLTASGGPFFGYTKSELENVRVEDALKHPNWSMGGKITIDSATLMNKGLELIEAMWLFDVSPEQVVITVHRQSIIHSMVEFSDNAVIAQLGTPDMRLPIQYALTFPDRLPSPAEALSIEKMRQLTFDYPDEDVFICLNACRVAAARGGTAPATVNGANEAAVELFMNGEIGFNRIGEIVMGAAEDLSFSDDVSFNKLREADAAAREYALAHVSKK